jgi:hypothetical protein
MLHFFLQAPAFYGVLACPEAYLLTIFNPEMIYNATTAQALISRVSFICETLRDAINAARTQSPEINIIADLSTNMAVIQDFDRVGRHLHSALYFPAFVKATPQLEKVFSAFDQQCQRAHISFDSYLSRSGLQVSSSFAMGYGIATTHDLTAHNVFQDSIISMGSLSGTSASAVFTSGLSLGPGGNSHSYSGLNCGAALIAATTSQPMLVDVVIGISGLTNLGSATDVVEIQSGFSTGVTTTGFRAITAANIVTTGTAALSVTFTNEQP